VASKFHSCFEPAAITTPAGDLHPEILDDIMDSLLALQGGGLTAERGTMVERKPKFSPERSFQQEVQSRVEERLAMLSRSRYGGRRIYLKTALLLLWSGASYIALLTWAQSGWQLVVPLSVSLGLALAGIGFNVAHDGNHGSFSTSRILNRAMGCMFDLLGASSYVWRWKHNVFHHSYTNVEGLDDDINLGALCRMSRHQPHLPYQRLQHLYMWILYAFIIPKWQLYDDFVAILRGRIGDNPFPRPRGGELALFLGGKLAFFTLAFALPLLFHPLWQVALVYACVSGVQGLSLSIVFQLAHSNEESSSFSADEPEDIARREWAVHQVETTANFARRSRFLTWYVGGLNHQIEHHLFPRISHVHLPVIAEVVEEVCREKGVRYSAHASFWRAVASHYSWLRSMGRPA
jgi:linoleoyl-CoA desaturase